MPTPEELSLILAERFAGGNIPGFNPAQLNMFAGGNIPGFNPGGTGSGARPIFDAAPLSTKKKDRSIGGFFSNLGGNAVDAATGLVTGVPAMFWTGLTGDTEELNAMGEGIYGSFKNMLWNEGEDAGIIGNLLHGNLKGAAASTYNRPFDALLDASMVAGGTAGIASKAGKVSLKPQIRASQSEMLSKTFPEIKPQADTGRRFLPISDEKAAWLAGYKTDGSGKVLLDEVARPKQVTRTQLTRQADGKMRENQVPTVANPYSRAIYKGFGSIPNKVEKLDGRAGDFLRRAPLISNQRKVGRDSHRIDEVASHGESVTLERDLLTRTGILDGVEGLRVADLVKPTKLKGKAALRDAQGRQALLLASAAKWAAVRAGSSADDILDSWRVNRPDADFEARIDKAKRSLDELESFDSVSASSVGAETLVPLLKKYDERVKRGSTAVDDMDIRGAERMDDGAVELSPRMRELLGDVADIADTPAHLGGRVLSDEFADVIATAERTGYLRARDLDRVLTHLDTVDSASGTNYRAALVDDLQAAQKASLDPANPAAIASRLRTERSKLELRQARLEKKVAEDLKRKDNNVNDTKRAETVKNRDDLNATKERLALLPDPDAADFDAARWVGDAQIMRRTANEPDLEAAYGKATDLELREQIMANQDVMAQLVPMWEKIIAKNSPAFQEARKAMVDAGELIQGARMQAASMDDTRVNQSPVDIIERRPEFARQVEEMTGRKQDIDAASETAYYTQLDDANLNLEKIHSRGSLSRPRIGGENKHNSSINIRRAALSMDPRVERSMLRNLQQEIEVARNLKDFASKHVSYLTPAEAAPLIRKTKLENGKERKADWIAFKDSEVIGRRLKVLDEGVVKAKEMGMPDEVVARLQQSADEIREIMADKGELVGVVNRRLIDARMRPYSKPGQLDDFTVRTTSWFKNSMLTTGRYVVNNGATGVALTGWNLGPKGIADLIHVRRNKALRDVLDDGLIPMDVTEGFFGSVLEYDRLGIHGTAGKINKGVLEAGAQAGDVIPRTLVSQAYAMGEIRQLQSFYGDLGKKLSDVEAAKILFPDQQKLMAKQHDLNKRLAPLQKEYEDLVGARAIVERRAQRAAPNNLQVQGALRAKKAELDAQIDKLSPQVDRIGLELDEVSSLRDAARDRATFLHERARKDNVDYMMTPTERIASNILSPFWSWQRGATKRWGRIIIENPVAYNLAVQKPGMGFNEYMEERLGVDNLPKAAMGLIPLTDSKYMSTIGANPIATAPMMLQDAMNFIFGGHSEMERDQSGKDLLAQTGPLLSIGTEMATGQDLYTGQTLDRIGSNSIPRRAMVELGDNAPFLGPIIGTQAQSRRLNAAGARKPIFDTNLGYGILAPATGVTIKQSSDDRLYRAWRAEQKRIREGAARERKRENMLRRMNE